MSRLHIPLRMGDEPLDLVCHRHPDHLDLEGATLAQPLKLEGLLVGSSRLVLRAGRHVVSGAVHVAQDSVHVSYKGRTWILARPDPAARIRAVGDPGGALSDVEAPMTGTLLEVLCEPGQQVEAGASLVVVEAMKMEHRLRAPAAARVTAILAKPGSSVDIGQVLVRLEPVETEP